ncbi:MAG: putative metal-dependent hydrolase [Methylophilaceae bacterium]|jgi:predicted metal-dependent hydrolase
MFSLSDIKELKLHDGSFINYELIKKYRRTVSLKITPKGLIVNAPILMTNYKINQLLQKKSKWIQKKLLLIFNDEEPFEIHNDAKFKIFDKELLISLREGENNIFIEGNQCSFKFKNLSDHPKLKKFFLIWIKKYALDYFTQRVKELCRENNLKVKSTLISNAKTRWGTCNNRKEVRLNWRLIQAPLFVIDYVICHELSHLKFMNHSSDFWKQVQLLFPNYKEAELYLKNNRFKLYRIG